MVPQEPNTRPGSGVGMYASAYQSQARIYQALAEARTALSLNHTAQASRRCSQQAGMGGFWQPIWLMALVSDKATWWCRPSVCCQHMYPGAP